ncbi:MAG: hypothetical protein JSW61_01085, partial [Candidatus Thorarchaeota archaeon]
IEVSCVKCKKPYEAEVIDHVDLSEDRELLKKLKTGKANRVQCPKCKKVMFLDRSIVINFEPQSLVVVFDPKARTKAAREEFEREFASVTSYSEPLLEAAEEMEFQVLKDLDKLKKLIDEYVAVYC